MRQFPTTILIGIIGMVAIGMFLRLSVKRQKAPSNAMVELREKVFSITPADIGIAPSATHSQVWGVVMEFQQSGVVVSVVGFADGTTSLYLSSGGGVIGGGEHPSIKTATTQWLQVAEQHLSEMTPAAEHPFPKLGRVCFYVLTYKGLLTADVDEEALKQRSHVLFPIFYAGHEVITQLRLMEEKQRK